MKGAFERALAPAWPSEAQVPAGEFEDFVRELAAVLVRPDRRDEPRLWARWAGSGSASSPSTTLKGQLGLEEHGGRTHFGVFVRATQRLLAFTAGVWHNWLIDAPTRRSLVAYDR